MDEIKSKKKKTKTNFTQLQYKWHSLLGVSVYTHIWDTFAKNKMVAKENKTQQNISTWESTKAYLL